ncbi:MAG: DUF4197 domain-containing protein [Bacteroidales bacterium]|nr:MAG: DUF4197 domain-containing protein [Bacteroidales bacterium]
MKKIITLLISFTLILYGCDILKELEVSTTSGSELTTDEIVQGLKEALRVGTNNAITTLSRENGFYGDPQLKIPFPEEAGVVEEKLRSVGMNKLVDDFIMNMNRGAEKAVTKAGPIFMDAIREIGFSDARNILNGPDNAATEYFRENTSQELADAFEPDVSQILDQVNVTKYWSDVMSTYNRIPFTQKVETDLAKYVTGKAVDGLFTMLAAEEKKIREDPVARVSDILKRVFGSVHL